MLVESILNTSRGLVIAPAGCGKTHLIIDTLKVCPKKPYLVLTHTTAGVAALKQRIKNKGIPQKHFHIATIDGWALRIAKMFPVSCAIQSSLDKPNVFYPELRRSVYGYMYEGHLNELILCSYSHLFVDEYQDCDVDQHNLVCTLSHIIPTVVFGDPMQAVFGFRGSPLPCWNSVVEPYFPQILKLETPWRWDNADKPQLGKWILKAREDLLNGCQVNLLTCPGNVNWCQLTGDVREDSLKQIESQYSIRKNNPVNESLLVIGDSKNKLSRHNFAKSAKGIDVVEPVDLGDVVGSVSKFDTVQGLDLVQCVLTAAANMMTGIGKANLIKRLETIIAKRNRIPENPTEKAARLLYENDDRSLILDLLITLEQNPNCKVFRKAAFSVLKEAVTHAASDPDLSSYEAVATIREQRRHYGDRRIPNRAIGSTLLLKGLEADHVLILDAGNMNNQHLYVALSRGAKSVTVFSQTNLVGG